MAKVIRLTPEPDDESDRPVLESCTISADTTALLEGVGQDLSKARQRSGKMLMDVSQELKIPPHHLMAIEAGRFDALPAPVYAVGFVRSYSSYLGLDVEGIVARLRAGMTGHSGDTPIASSSPERQTLKAEPLRSAQHPVAGFFSSPERKISFNVIPGLMIAGLIYSGYSIFASAQRAVPPPVMSVPARLAIDADLTHKEEVVHRRTVQSAAVLLPDPVLVVSADLPPIDLPALASVAMEPAPSLPRATALASLPEAALTQLAMLEPKPAPPRQSPVLQTGGISAEPGSRSHAPLPLGRRYGMENRNSRIILRVHRSIHLAVQGTRDRIFIDRNLEAGDTYRVPNVSGVKLSASDAGAIEVILDDTTVGFAGENGVRTKGLSLDPQNIIHHQQRG